MGFDPDLAERIRAVLATEPGVTENRMFGGLAFLVDGKMAVAANRNGALMARVDPEDSDGLVERRHVARMTMRGRPMDGWLVVDAAALAADPALRGWVERGVAYARSLPAKQKAGAR